MLRVHRRTAALFAGLVALLVLALVGTILRGIPAALDTTVSSAPAAGTGRMDPTGASPGIVPVSAASASARPRAQIGAAAPRARLDQQVLELRARVELAQKDQAQKDQPQEARSTVGRFEPVAVPASGPGSYTYAHRKVAPATGRGTLKRYDVRVEKGLDLDADETALLIAKVLNDRRSWTGTGRWRFQLVSAGQSADLHIHIATPRTTDRLCAPLLTRGEVSCQNGNRVVLNAKRWLRGVKYYAGDLTGYQRYLVNHEVGHALDHDHVGCPGPGRPAPVMMQQTKGLGGCRKNPWPRSDGD